MKKLLHLRIVAFAFFAFTSLTARAVEQPARPPLLAVGTEAPNFMAHQVDRTEVRLSDFRGKVVLVDFWSTWCGPCKAAMHHLEKIHEKLKDQNFVVLGVCVWDERTKFNTWMKSPEVPTTYLKVFDPVGKNSGDIARKLYHVSGIPTFYLIDQNGTIRFAGVGASRPTQVALDQALAELGFKL